MSKIRTANLFAPVLVVMIIGAIALLVSTTGGKAATINVDDSGGQQYTTIQAAVNASSPGDTIYVYNGTYNENITLNKSINLTGESNQSTIIMGTGAPHIEGIHVTVDYVNISNLKIANFDYGIYLPSGSNNTIASNALVNCSYGIYLLSGSNNTVASNALTNSNIIMTGDNTLSNNTINGKPVLYYKNIDARASPQVLDNVDANEIILYNCSGFVIKNMTIEYGSILLIGNASYNNTITFNTLANGSYGICTYAGSNNTIASNTLSNYSNYGIGLGSGSNNTITSNTLADCSYTGVYIASSSSNNTITGNIVTNCGDDGISFDTDTNNNTVAQNTVTNCSYGIYFDSDSHNNTVTGNTVMNCGDDGISFDTDTNNNAVTGNTVTDCSYGIYFDSGSSNNTVDDNIVTNCIEDGISFDSDTNNNTVTGNTVTNCSYGIYFYSGSGNNTITSNTITSGSRGIRLDSSSNNSITSNTIANCSYGIRLTSSSNDNIITSNTVTNSEDYGIYLGTGSNSGTITSNTVTNCSYGIRLSSSSDNSVTSNTITNSGDCGIYIHSGSNDSIITSNIITNCNDGIYLYSSSNNNITSNTLMNSDILMDSDNTLSNNTINGKPVLYYRNIDARSSPQILDNVNASEIILYNCSGFVIKNTTIEYGAILLIGGSSYNTIMSNTIANSSYCSIGLDYSSNNSITSNTITNSSYYGIGLDYCSNNTIASNTITNSGDSGIGLDYSSNNTIMSNTIANSDYCGIGFGSSSNNNITANNIYGSGQYGLAGDGTGNTAYNNWWGSASGPYNNNSNPNGTGDNVTEGVPFSPWATAVIGVPSSLNYPSAPAITTAAYTDTDGAYQINWTSSDYAASYILEENGTVVYNGTALTYSFTGKSNGAYAYRVRAWNANGTSNWSTPVTITVENKPAASEPKKGFLPGLETVTLLAALGMCALIVNGSRKRKR